MARIEDRAIVDQLCEHLMGPLDVRDMASSVPVSVKAEGALGREGVIVSIGAQAQEGARAREGRRCEHLQS
jgi:hypothetical protein